jgi:hypothetical protein
MRASPFLPTLAQGCFTLKRSTIFTIQIDMTRKSAKGINFQKLIARADLAIQLTFYLEANWIVYSLIENRIKSLTLEKLALTPLRDNYHGCIEVMLKNIEQNQIIKNIVTENLLMILDEWRLERNDLMHELAKEDIDEARIIKVANEGRKLLGKIASVNMKVKKKN